MKMILNWVFKDVAYESLVNEKFITIARAAMPNVEALHEEFGAAKEAMSGGSAR